MPKKRVKKKKSSTTVRKKAATTTRKAAKRPPARKAAAGKEDAPLAQLERLIAMMVEKEVVEVEYEQTGTRWRVRRAEAQSVAYAAPPTIVSPPAVAPVGAAPVAHAAPSEAEPEGDVFHSPMVGTIYHAPSPDAEPFVKVGDQVTGDRTLCIIEAMKVMNEIKAERDFEILEVLVKNGESVEFGQPLFMVR